MGVVARTAVAGRRSTGSAISQGALPFSRGYSRWNSAKHWHLRRLGCTIALGSNITPFPKPSEKAQLVRRGIFSLIRHPIYTGVMFASLGWALVWQSWPTLLMALVLILFFDAKARREEEWLREKFSEYGEYEKCVKRFIPRIY